MANEVKDFSIETILPNFCNFIALLRVCQVITTYKLVHVSQLLHTSVKLWFSEVNVFEFERSNCSLYYEKHKVTSSKFSLLLANQINSKHTDHQWNKKRLHLACMYKINTRVLVNCCFGNPPYFNSVHPFIKTKIHKQVRNQLFHYYSIYYIQPWSCYINDVTFFLCFFSPTP